jgi:hypothetical protein
VSSCETDAECGGDFTIRRYWTPDVLKYTGFVNLAWECVALSDKLEGARKEASWPNRGTTAQSVWIY